MDGSWVRFPVFAREATLQPEVYAARPALLRSYEWLLAGYFGICAVRATAHGLVGFAITDAMVPLLFVSLGLAYGRMPVRWLSIVRDWAAMPFLLLAYWNSNWVAQAHKTYAFGHRWIGFDRMVLDGWGVRQAIESCGLLLPSILEFCYLVLYAVPPLLLGALYLCGRRKKSEPFLLTIFAGVLFAFALMPLFPSASPRLVFPGQDLPPAVTVFRRINVWLLDTLDTQTSVFPSGHVAVAFSCAFAAATFLPDRRWLVRFAFLFATIVAAATVYGRYHYVVDVLAGLSASAAGWVLSRAVERRALRRSAAVS